ncbi:MAG: hypothetical protein AAGB97_07385 [Dehalococcoidia bacterium]|nr:hypothetical protein [Chloroflexota bacterium]
MTQLLEKAFKKASKLPEMEQNVIAKWLIDELESEKKWERLFAESEDILEKLADEALAEHAQGKTNNETMVGDCPPTHYERCFPLGTYRW